MIWTSSKESSGTTESWACSIEISSVGIDDSPMKLGLLIKGKIEDSIEFV